MSKRELWHRACFPSRFLQSSALTLKPDYIEAQLALANLRIRAEDFAEAMAIARQVQRQAPQSPVGFVVEGNVLMAQNKFRNAAEAYEKAYGISKSGFLVTKLHTAYMLAGEPEQAEKRLSQWLKESPDDIDVRLYAANTSIRRGAYDDAIGHYELILQQQPDNVVALNNLAFAYQQVNDPRALKTAERAHELAPQSPAVADTLGWMLVEQGDAARGLELLQQAVAAAPNAPEIRYHLAQAWLKAGDKPKARRELETLLASGVPFPQQAEARKLLDEFKE